MAGRRIAGNVLLGLGILLAAVGTVILIASILEPGCDGPPVGFDGDCFGKDLGQGAGGAMLVVGGCVALLGGLVRGPRKDAGRT